MLPCVMCTFFAQSFEGKIRICILYGQYQKYLVSVLVLHNYLLHKISCTVICLKINAKIPYNAKSKIISKYK